MTGFFSVSFFLRLYILFTDVLIFKIISERFCKLLPASCNHLLERSGQLSLMEQLLSVVQGYQVVSQRQCYITAAGQDGAPTHTGRINEWHFGPNDMNRQDVWMSREKASLPEVFYLLFSKRRRWSSRQKFISILTFPTAKKHTRPSIRAHISSDSLMWPNQRPPQFSHHRFSVLHQKTFWDEVLLVTPPFSPDHRPL